MDKKNTMLLTVIAVATLLVAVVGATFAYFSLTATDSSQTAAINTTTEQLGTIALTTTTTEMHITTTATDFAQDNQGTYWATATNGTHYVANEEKDTIYTIAVSGGSTTAVYKCDFTFTVVSTGLPTSSIADDGEYVVYLYGTDNALAHTLDMGNTGTTAGNRSKTYNVTTYLTGSGASKTLKASAKLVNTNAPQNSWQNMTAATTFNVTANSLNCQTVATAGTEVFSAAV